MSQDRARRLVDLYLEAGALGAEERGALVERIRADEPGLASDLEDLLKARGAGPVSERLSRQYGSEVDPQISLGDAGEGDSDFTSDVVERLAEHSPASGRYKLKGEIARGGQGAILRVWDEDLRRNLAMKVILGSADGSSTEAIRPDAVRATTPAVDSRTLARFLEEAQVTGQLDHPGIVPVHELGLDSQGGVYFTMRLVKGEHLGAILEKVRHGEGGWNRTRALGTLLKACEALAYAHDKGVIHRDLKPSNIMVGRFGEVYVMDWGLARVLGSDDGRDLRLREVPPEPTSSLQTVRKDASDPDSPLITMDGHVVGTPAYMSPEQANGNVAAMGPTSDVYAMGAILYQLIAGHPPFMSPGAALNNYAIWARVQEGAPPDVRNEAPRAPVELVAICEKAMSREQSDRYSTVIELADDLRSFVEGRVVQAYEEGALAELRKWVLRNRFLAGLVGVVIVLLTLAAGVFGSVQGRLREASDAIARAEGGKLIRAAAEKLKALEADVVEERNGRMWPATSELVEVYQDWLQRAEEEVIGLDVHFGALTELRKRALPRSAVERDAEMRSHSRYNEYRLMETALQSLQRAQDVREGKAPFEPFELPPGDHA